MASSLQPYFSRSQIESASGVPSLLPEWTGSDHDMPYKPNFAQSDSFFLAAEAYLSDACAEGESVLPMLPPSD